MRQDILDKEVLQTTLVAHAVKLEELAHALGDTPSAATTARIGLFFGPTVCGYRAFVNAVDLDLDRALLGGHEIRWSRPFDADEPLSARMVMTEHSLKNGMEFGVFETSFRTPGGELVQTQRTTFIERAPQAK
jgi:hypothetical protein